MLLRGRVARHSVHSLAFATVQFSVRQIYRFIQKTYPFNPFKAGDSASCNTIVADLCQVGETGAVPTALQKWSEGVEACRIWTKARTY